MTLASWIRFCFSFYFSFYILASAFVVPYNGQQPISVPPTEGQSFLRTAPDDAVADCPRRNPDVKDGTLIDQLWKRNCDLVWKFLNNKFSTFQAEADSPAAFQSFQYYSVQDYYYLLETAQHKAFLMATWPPSDPVSTATQINNTVQSMSDDLKYARGFRADLTRLQVPDDIIDSGTLQAAGLGYVKSLQESTHLGWFEFQVSRIACIYGWAELASQLNMSSSTNKSTVFYKEWIEPNLGWSYGADMSEELEKELPFSNNSRTFPIYNQLFRQGLRFEIAFFESAIGKTLNDTA
ncbi:putative TENA THI-4 family protein [Rosellinia necatrix]|uniref:Putative TENA THI-4 family protein n=1 Tax=Rosellinia necatrix TaxID=77044 RepID=A0A1W2TSP5_ROSNE|nr:putative TENA THI-4 family protein [Rosellinia necatrix]